MPNVTKLQPLPPREDLPGVSVFPLSNTVQAGEAQDVLVEVVPDGVIPQHSHQVDATMIIVGGTGEVLSEDPTIAGRLVEPHDIVFFEKNKLHGFRASGDGLVFISRNGGIVDQTPDSWDISFAAK